MNLIRDDIRKLYLKFLFPSMAGAMVMSVYSFVDAIAVGQSEGALGTAAMAVISPVYGITVFLAILCGVGGSVLMSIAKSQGNEEKGNACFTASVILIGLLTLAVWAAFLLFQGPIFSLFGADDTVMPKTIEYGRWVVWFMPVFIFPIFIGAFLRNDSAPRLAMTAVIVGGCVNMFGDWFLVFPMKMGMNGAAIATVIGTCVQGLIMISHFFCPNCTLKLVRPRHTLRGIGRILRVGFEAGVLDLGSVAIAALMNNQIVAYGSATELAIFGVLSTIMALFQALFGGVGQAIQPLVSANFGARQKKRIRQVWTLSLRTVLLMGIAFTLLGELFPVPITRIFMAATPEVLAAAPEICRLFFPLFPFLGVVVLGDYMLQSVMEEKMSAVLGLMHSALLSGAMILILPRFLGLSGVWLAMPITELITAAVAYLYTSKKLRREERPF